MPLQHLRTTKIRTRRLFLYPMLAAAVFGVAVRELGSETMTMIATYPSPIGIYRSMVTTGGTPVRPAYTDLSRDAGSVRIGTMASSTDSRAKLIMGGDIDLMSHRIVNGAVPVNAGDLATKGYVDASISPGSWSCAVVSAPASPPITQSDTMGAVASVACPGPTDKVISGGCMSTCGVSGGPTNQGWQCLLTSGGCRTIVYANCCH